MTNKPENHTEASAPREEMETLVLPIVLAARTGDYSTASRLLNHLFRILQEELSGGRVSAENLSKLTYSLETLMAMQKMENWVAFADILEYEFVPLWKRIGAAPNLSGRGESKSA